MCTRLKSSGQCVGRSLRQSGIRSVYVTVVSVYAPTFRSTAEQKEHLTSRQS